MGHYKSSSQQPTCLKCPANSWSFRSGQTSCKCQHEFYRENTFDFSTACLPAIRIKIGKDLNFQFISPNILNVSVIELNERILMKLKCDNEMCRKNQLSASKNWMLLDTTRSVNMRGI